MNADRDNHFFPPVQLDMYILYTNAESNPSNPVVEGSEFVY